MTVLTLLTLGLSYKGNYGEVPNSRLSSLSLEKLVFSSGTNGRYPFNSKVHSLFVRDKGQEPALIILMQYNEGVTRTVRRSLGTRRTPLLFSISSLPNKEHDLNVSLFRFGQSSRTWFPEAELEEAWFPALEEGRTLPAGIRDGEIQQGIILLPEWFNLHKPVTIAYTQNARTVRFL
jgi:hypothetical protein